MRLYVTIHKKDLIRYLAHSKPSISGRYTNDNFEKHIPIINVRCVSLRAGYIRLGGIPQMYLTTDFTQN